MIGDPFDEGCLIALPVSVVVNIAEAFTEQSMEILKLVLGAPAGLSLAIGLKAWGGVEVGRDAWTPTG